MSQYLQKLIPASNTLDASFASNRLLGGRLVESSYDAGFIGAFNDTDEMPQWARNAARYIDDEFLRDTPGNKKRFEDVETLLADGDGECHMPFRHALEMWDKSGKRTVTPYSTSQVFGSCVDASAAEGCTGLVAYRAAQAGYQEDYIHPVAWYWYADRGYCSDGWTGSGVAARALRHGLAFRTKYEFGSGVDFTDDDRNERIVAREWCRSGIPGWLHDHTIAKHPFEDGAITKFGSQNRSEGMSKLKKAFKAGGFVHHSGTRTSGGNKPFSIGSTGAHMQTAHGYDDSEEFRKFCQDVLRITPRADDFPVVSHQTWGSGWRGETADQYWPSWWGPKPQGAWVWWASDLLSRISCDYIWLPWCKGFPAVNPVPPTPPVVQVPKLEARLYAEQVGSVIAIRGDLVLEGKHEYIVVPDGAGAYRTIPKPVV